jgi:hypothetical protein
MKPVTEEDNKARIEMELNHGRLAMISFFGMYFQEVLTGIPVSNAFYNLVEKF